MSDAEIFIAVLGASNFIFCGAATSVESRIFRGAIAASAVATGSAAPIIFLADTGIVHT